MLSLAGARNGLIPVRALNDPEYPAGAVIMNTKTGDWRALDDTGHIAAAGTTWHCNYCDFRDRCTQDGVGTQPEELF